MINGGYPETPDAWIERQGDDFSCDETLQAEDRDESNETREAHGETNGAWIMALDKAIREGRKPIFTAN